jgi:hypothetical protein
MVLYYARISEKKKMRAFKRLGVFGGLFFVKRKLSS